MLAVLQYSFNAVMPIILLILLGVFARRKGFLEPPTLRKVNKFNFRFNFFAMMFMNLYEVESIRQMPVRMGVFMIASHCLLVLIGIVLSGFLTRNEGNQRIQKRADCRCSHAPCRRSGSRLQSALCRCTTWTSCCRTPGNSGRGCNFRLTTCCLVHRYGERDGRRRTSGWSDRGLVQHFRNAVIVRTYINSEVARAFVTSSSLYFVVSRYR